MRCLLLVALVACGHPSHAPSAPAHHVGPAGPPLYDRIGRMDAIKGIVKDFVEDQLLKGPLAPRFSAANIPRLEDELARQLCELAGGPCKYTGKPMREAHAGMPITEAEFTGFVDAFAKSLAKFKVEAVEQRELLALVKQQHDVIVVPQ